MSTTSTRTRAGHGRRGASRISPRESGAQPAAIQGGPAQARLRAAPVRPRARRPRRRTCCARGCSPASGSTCCSTSAPTRASTRCGCGARASRAASSPSSRCRTRSPRSSGAPRGDPRWEARRLALSDADGAAEIHVAGNSTSSSLLEMGERHLAQRARVGLRGQRRGADRAARLAVGRAVGGERVFLKLDVQGFEMHVLRGAERVARRARAACRRSWRSRTSTRATRRGARWSTTSTRAASSWPGSSRASSDPDSGRMLQFDGVFLRS